MPPRPDTPHAAAITHVGMRRQHNEDCYGIDEALGLFIVADGLGGHTAGEVASRTVVTVMRDTLHEQLSDSPVPADDTSATSRHAIRLAVAAANENVFKLNQARAIKQGQGMGATLAGVYLPPSATDGIVFHVGDCRVYLWRGQRLQALTQDHSLYQKWRSSGQDGPAPNKNVVLRAVGPWDRIEVETQTYLPHSDDLLLICSDGLTDMVSHAALEQALRNSAGDALKTRCADLVELANANGGHDNITAMLVHWQSLEVQT